MGIVRATLIWCDNQCESGPVEGANAREAIKIARDEGWKVNAAQREFTCPDCADWGDDENAELEP
jgi:hypothetical protein